MEGREAPNPGRFIADDSAIEFDPGVGQELVASALHSDPHHCRSDTGPDDHPLEGHRADQAGRAECAMTPRPDPRP